MNWQFFVAVLCTLCSVFGFLISLEFYAGWRRAAAATCTAATFLIGCYAAGFF